MVAEADLLVDDPFPWQVLKFDGMELHSRPGVDADMVDVMHDVTHYFLAKAIGAKNSPALLEAMGIKQSPQLLRAEEAVVLAMQDFVRMVLEE